MEASGWEAEAQKASELPEATPWVKGRAETQTQVFVRSELEPFRWSSLKIKPGKVSDHSGHLMDE